MSRLFRTTDERKRTLWQRVVDIAFTDVRVAVGGMDHESLEQLEERLLAADFGVPATLRLVDYIETLVRQGEIRENTGLSAAIAEEVERILLPVEDSELRFAESGPTVYLIVGVNGVGKTTSIGKLAYHLRRSGRSVMVAAGDTYRAGAVEQLSLWAKKVGADFIGGQKGGDPAAVAFDALEAALARSTDVVLVDTAGRLHTQRGLMEELQKVDRVIRKKIEGAPHETLIVLDATVGQNAVAQVRAFREATTLSGIVLAKMDSTARGGIVVALREEFGLPVKLVGTGETAEDLDAFDPRAFLEGVFAT